MFDRRLRIAPNARVFSTLADGPVIILTSLEAVGQRGERARALEEKGATLLALDSPDIAVAVRALGRRGVQSLLVDGGATLHQAIWDARIVDYAHLYVAPTLLGSRGPALLPGSAFGPASLRDQQVQQLGPDVLFEGYVHRPD